MFIWDLKLASAAWPLVTSRLSLHGKIRRFLFSDLPETRLLYHFDLANAVTFGYPNLVPPRTLKVSLANLISFRTKEVTVLSGDADVYSAANKKTTSTLTIAEVAADNAGEYKCTADFRGTTVSSNTAIVSVYGELGQSFTA